jgi:hypothetical protein
MAFLLSAVVTSANTHEVIVAIETVDSMIINRKSSSSYLKKQSLSLDKSYHSKDVEQEIIKK